jgi:hypothetical protein
VLPVGFEPTYPARNYGFKDRCAYQFHNGSKHSEGSFLPSFHFFILRDVSIVFVIFLV